MNLNEIVKLGLMTFDQDPMLLANIIKGNELIPSLDGSGKMSKTGNSEDTIYVSDSKEDIARKIDRIAEEPKSAPILFHLWWVSHSEEEKNEVAWMLSKILVNLL